MFPQLFAAAREVATARSLLGVTAVALFVLVIALVATFYSPIPDIAKYVFGTLELSLFAAIYFHVARRTPKIPPGIGERYFELLVERGAAYGDDGRLIALDQLRELPAIDSPQGMLPPGESGEDKEEGV